MTNWFQKVAYQAGVIEREAAADKAVFNEIYDFIASDVRKNQKFVAESDTRASFTHGGEAVFSFTVRNGEIIVDGGGGTKAFPGPQPALDYMARLTAIVSKRP